MKGGLLLNTNVDIHERIKFLREEVLNLKQSEMSLIIGLKQGSLSDIERKKTKTVTDRIIKDICREFNISEYWLRTGEGEIFVKLENFSLDEQAKKSNLSELEIAIMRGYMNLDRDIREKLMNELEAIFKPANSESVATVEDRIKTGVTKHHKNLEENLTDYQNFDKREEATKIVDNDIDIELAKYRMELEAEKKAKTLLVSEKHETN